MASSLLVNAWRRLEYKIFATAFDREREFLARGRTDNALQIVKSIDLGSIDSDDRVARLETSPLGR